MGLLDEPPDGLLERIRGTARNHNFSGHIPTAAANDGSLRSPLWRKPPLGFSAPTLAGGPSDWAQTQLADENPSVASLSRLRASRPPAQTVQNLTAHVLRTKGLSDDVIATAIGDPELMKQLIYRHFGRGSAGIGYGETDTLQHENKAASLSRIGSPDQIAAQSIDILPDRSAGSAVRLAQYAPARPALPLPGIFIPGTVENDAFTKDFIHSGLRAGHAVGDAIWGILHNESDDPADKPAGTPVGRRGSEINVIRGTNKPGNIGGRIYTGHGLDQMQGRGVTPSPVEETIQNGRRSPGNRPGTMVHTGDDGIAVVTGPDGRVITVKPVDR
jgi:hypothetical protein